MTAHKLFLALAAIAGAMRQLEGLADAEVDRVLASFARDNPQLVLGNAKGDLVRDAVARACHRLRAGRRWSADGDADTARPAVTVVELGAHANDGSLHALRGALRGGCSLGLLSAERRGDWRAKGEAILWRAAEAVNMGVQRDGAGRKVKLSQAGAAGAEGARQVDRAFWYEQFPGDEELLEALSSGSFCAEGGMWRLVSPRCLAWAKSAASAQAPPAPVDVVIADLDSPDSVSQQLEAVLSSVSAQGLLLDNAGSKEAALADAMEVADMHLGARELQAVSKPYADALGAWGVARGEAAAAEVGEEL